MSVGLWLVDHGRHVFAVAVVGLLAGAGFWAALSLPGVLDDVGPGAASALAAPSVDGSQRASGAEPFKDSDGDGLSDVSENFVYGSDPFALSTTGNGIPDGWFAGFGFDPTEPGVERRPAALPDVASLPAVYAGGWPEAYGWTLEDAYGAGRPADWNESGDGPWDSGIDPREASAGPDAIAYSWLVHYGLDATDADIGAARLGGSDFTVRENFQQDTDPRLDDTDGDGLSDASEVGVYGTDPRLFSTSRTGIPDGWLVRFGFDPTDAGVAARDPAMKGMSVLEVFEYNVARFGLEAAVAGEGLDPARTSTLGLRIPDGWLVEHGLDPLDSGVEGEPQQQASDFPDLRDLDSAPADKEPLGDLELSVIDAYAFKRPAGWVESQNGPWKGGLDPGLEDQDGDGLPDAVEMRGWYASRLLGTGLDARMDVYVAHSDPLRADSDEDGLSDAEEYFGRAVREGRTYEWVPSDPMNADTAFSGLTDAQKVLGYERAGVMLELSRENDEGVWVPILQPVRMDGDGDHIADGAEVEMWADVAASVQLPYTQRFPGTDHETVLEWVSQLEAFVGTGLSVADAARLLGPLGDIDDDGIVNVADDDADDDGLVDGFERDPSLLVLAGVPAGGPRLPTDPANPDTDGDGLPDEWELRHGLFDAVAQRWDLDPRRWSSRGDGVSDGDANLDGDVVPWWTFRGQDAQTRQPEPRFFEYTNAFEFAQDTDPRLADEDGDGIHEGWLYFWTKEYPARVLEAIGDPGSGTEAIGDVRPPTIGPNDPVKQLLAGAAGPVAEASKYEEALAYTRVVEVVGDPESFLDPERSEAWADGWPKVVDVQRDHKVVSRNVGVIEGTYRHTLLEDAALALNPYLADTDGDGLADDWESLWSPCSAPAVGTMDPLVPDAGGDPDRDALSNVEEQDVGTDPCSVDSDVGGIQDGVEQGLAGLDPLDPADDAVQAGPGDVDGDEIPDAEELRDGTNPASIDTDRDGLLDGLNIDFDVGDEKSEKFLSLGIAHHIQGEKIVFLGEEENGGSPTQRDTSGDGVPDGWLAYYTQDAGGSAGLNPDTLRARYACGMPSWWDEQRLGVWWWGQSPFGAAGCGTDMDFDGLDDATGEDPVPAARVDVVFGETPLQDRLSEPLSVEDSLALGQSWGVCAGDPQPCRAQWQELGLLEGRAPVRFVNVDDGLPEVASTPTLTKGSTFTVTGRLELACGGPGSCEGVADRTVVVEAVDDGGEPLVLGVGFTESDGSFSVPAALAAGGAATIPEEGMVALGRGVAGPVEWSTAWDGVEAGDDVEVRVRAYATTRAFWADDKPDAEHPHFGAFVVDGVTYDATARATQSVTDARIASPTQLSVSAPPRLAWAAGARSLEVTAQLSDVSGLPAVSEAVMVSASGLASRSGVTGSDGSASVTFDVPSEWVGPVTVTAAYAGNAARGLLASSTSEGRVVPVQGQAFVSLVSVPASVRLGDVVEVVAEVTVQGQPASGVDVTASFGFVSVEGTTGQDGRVRLDVPVQEAEPGVGSITVRVAATDDHTAAETRVDLAVVTGTVLDLVVPTTMGHGAPATVSGRLRGTDSVPVEGASLVIFLGGVHLASATTGADGRFEVVFEVPSSVAAGTQSLHVEYAGQPGLYDGVEDVRSTRVVVPTKMVLSPAKAGQGSMADIRGRLTSLLGEAVVGHRVLVTIDGERLGSALTASDGSFGVRPVLDSNVTLGVHRIGASFKGSDNGTFGASSVQARLLVGAPTSLRTEPPPFFVRGNNTLVGFLETPAGEALADEVVVVEHGQTRVVATTDGDGVFRAPVAIGPDVAPGHVPVHVSFAGTESLGPSVENTTVALRTPVRVSVHSLSDAGRGSTLRVTGSVMDDRGKHIVGGHAVLALFGHEHEQRLVGVPLEFEVDVPADLAVGNTTLRLAYAGDAYHEPATAARTLHVKDGVVLEVLDVPERLEPGEAFEVGIRLTDAQGNPLPGESVGVRRVGDAVAVLATTDADGYAKVALTAPSDGNFSIHALFPGDGTLAAQSASSSAVAVEQPGFLARSGPVLGWLALAAAVVLLALAAFVLRRGRSQRQVVSVLKEAERRIRAGDPWAAAVMIAYRRLSDYLSTLGFEERPGETPRGFVDALRRRVPVPDDAAVALVSLFERARYLGGSMAPSDAHWARSTLHAVIGSVNAAIAAHGRRGPSSGEVAS